MVVQGATLIIWIGAAVFVPTTVVVGVMMVDVTDLSAFGEVGNNVLLALEGMLNMYADQWHDAHHLGQQEKP
jgi:hypothetical protein